MSGSLLDRLGQVDNLNDPQPILNSKAGIFGVVFTFLVSFPQPVYGFGGGIIIVETFDRIANVPWI